MRHALNRRQFLAASAATAGLLASGGLQAAEYKTKLKKALIGNPDEKTLSAWKAAGFDGMETGKWDVAPEEAAKGRKLAESLSMEIHSVLYGWANFNSEKAEDVTGELAKVDRALKATQGYGANALLLVPCRLTRSVKVPQPWEFDIELDEKTSHVRRVVEGDNSPYAEYIAEQNRATDASRKAVEALIPVAEKTGVIIALENVWNQFWVKPNLFANFVASFDSPFVKAYFDIGNHVKYAKPEEWFEALGKLIVKLHVKDFKVDREAKSGGAFVDIRDGDVNWPAVRQHIERIGYNDYMTIEGSGGLSLEERSKRLDLIIAGK
ncbi:MAG: sugar phosphate isomerase/epimerase family protein [Thermoguttaceae bacterium]|jgi:L-ribulose-5-phosphate 3-epimerase